MRPAHAALALVIAGCAQVLGLEDAEEDPTFTGGAGGRDAGAGGSANGGMAEATGGAGGTAGLALCEEYCATVMASCVDDHAVYNTLESCMGVCALLPEGDEADEIGNSIHCRLRNAQIAPTEPSFYCPIVGPGGQGICGTNCEALCTIVDNVCVDELQQWPSAIACQNDCAEIQDLRTYTVAPEAKLYQGPHVQCRLFHVSSAVVTDASIHCPHAGGDPPCAETTDEGGAGGGGGS